ncbi:unnamed protein product [Schistosoma mattheei]|uniref:Uncharacterized protein n=1 Tax=Schistosoma mattheei TaxID=31246 RepID=A0A183NQ67_9TREM|nr:unnamed protein product [Schistosoma mattheei]
MTGEKATREGNMKRLYDTTKELAGYHRKPERPVKSKEGNHTQQQLQKTTNVAAASAALSLNIQEGKSKILRYDMTYTNRITLDREDLEDVKTLTYLGSIIDEDCGFDAEVKARIGKARIVYLQLKNIWN